MRVILRSRAIPAALLLAALCCAPAAPSQNQAGAVALAEKQISEYLEQLADVHCTETVVQEKLAEDGHVEASAREQFDYLIMMSGNEDDFQLTESRIEPSGFRRKLLSFPMLVTNGMSTMLVVFHPYYSDSFQFETHSEELIDGRTTIPIVFTEIPGRRTPAALALRGREYPLYLQGTAWLDKKSGEVVKMDASLLHEMSDVGLRSLSIHVEYRATQLGTGTPQVMMPSLAVVDVTTPRQHWRNTHFFGNYQSFSTSVEQEPGVKVHNSGTNSDHQPVVRPAFDGDMGRE